MIYFLSFISVHNCFFNHHSALWSEMRPLAFKTTDLFIVCIGSFFHWKPMHLFPLHVLEAIILLQWSSSKLIHLKTILVHSFLKKEKDGCIWDTLHDFYRLICRFLGSVITKAHIASITQLNKSCLFCEPYRLRLESSFLYFWQMFDFGSRGIGFFPFSSKPFISR